MLRTAACGGQAGPPANLSFEAPGQVARGVSARLAPPGQEHGTWVLSIAVTPPPDAGFQFLPGAVQVAGSRDGAGERVQPNVQASISQRLAARSWIDISSLGPTSLDAAGRAMQQGPEAEVAAASLGFGSFPGAPHRLQVELELRRFDRGLEPFNC